MAEFTVPLKRIIEDFRLETLVLPEDIQDIVISSKELNRPGLQFSGYYDYFDPSRMQIVGRTELSYIYSLSNAEREKKIRDFLAHRPKAVIITRNLDIYEEMIRYAEEYGVALLRTMDDTSVFISSVLSLLNVELAPRITRHGGFIEVYGEGILLLGESGVGKSETAIELVKRGHRLIADDAVELRKVSNRTVVGTSPENIRHFVELRGIGIINARRIFGMGAVKVTEKVDMVIQMEPWDQNKTYDRIGMDNEYFSILGIEIPTLVIPVKPGRNLAIIIEVAAMNNRQKKMGYNGAAELMQHLGMEGNATTMQNGAFDMY